MKIGKWEIYWNYNKKLSSFKFFKFKYLSNKQNFLDTVCTGYSVPQFIDKEKDFIIITKICIVLIKVLNFLFTKIGKLNVKKII